MTDGALLEVRGLSKSYAGVEALKAVSLTLRQGEIHGIVGENGAGKSTLVRILSGRIPPNAGTMLLEGNPIIFHRPGDAIRFGIAMIPQELTEFDHLSVAENLFVGKLNGHLFGLVNRRDVLRYAEASLREFDLDIDPNLPVKRLSIGHRQVLQIIRMVNLAPRVLILDEPTASLDVNESRDLFRLLRALNEKGVSILYISHHLQELFGLIHTVTVLRDGRAVGTRSIDEVSQEDLVRMMIGRDLQDLYAAKAYSSLSVRGGKVCLEARQVSSGRLFHDVTFSLREGEILGFFGLVGAGRSELFKAIVGVYPVESGKVSYLGRTIKLRGVKDAVANSIGYLPEDRKRNGLFVHLGLDANLIAPQIKRFSRPIGIWNGRKIEEFARRMIKELNIVTPSTRASIANLSGGNQQKVLLGMWSGIDPRVLIVDEPTKGVDVATKQLIYLRIRELADRGVGIVLISSDLPEIIHLSDRIMVMREGRIAGEIARDEDRTEERIMKLAVGVREGNRSEDEDVRLDSDRA